MIWSSILSIGRSDPSRQALPGIDWPLRLVRHATARRYRLVVLGERHVVRLTLPRRAAIGPALAWAEEQRDWVAGEIAKAQTMTRIAPGAIIPIEGVPTTIRHDPAIGRRVVQDDGMLIVGGPAEQVGTRVLRWLRALALSRLTAETQALAEAHSLPLTHVAIGDPRRRWGSCSARGAIRYSWRLILAPASVRQATVAHEVAHLRHMDHSAAFHAFHRAISASDVDAARAWLRGHGEALHRVSA